MKILEKNSMRVKLVREIFNTKVRFLAITFVVVIGVTIFVASSMSYKNLETSYKYTYKKLNFADFRVKSEKIPKYIVDRTRKVKGVTMVTPRLRKDLSFILPNEKHLVGRVIGIPESRPLVDDLLVKEGRFFKKGDSMVCIAESHFASFYKLHPGDVMIYRNKGSDVPVKIIGVAGSPEYLVLAGEKGDFSPMLSATSMAILWMPVTDVQSMAEMPGEYNQLLFKVKNPANMEQQISEVEGIMKYTGIKEVVPQEEHLGNQMLQRDLEGFKSFALFFPLLFLAIACFSIYILLSRLVHVQRPFIGVMRATGYTKKQILSHYLSFALIIGILGAVFGAVAGYGLSYLITSAYAGTIGIPMTSIKTYWLVVFEGVSLSMIFCAFAGIMPAFHSTRIDPAKAMRGEMLEQTFHRPLLERVFPPLSRVPLFLKLPFRNMFRNRRRTVFTILGLVFSTMLVLAFLGSLDTVKNTMNRAFNANNRFDMVAVFLGGRDAATIGKIKRIPGVEDVEPNVSYGVKIRWDGDSADTVMMGLLPDTQLRKFYTPDHQEVKIEDRHVLLNNWYHSKKGLQVGQTVTVSTTWRKRKFIVGQFIEEAMGNVIYLPRDEALNLVAYGQMSRGSFYIKVRPGHYAEARADLEKIPGMATLIDLKEIKREVDHYVGLMHIIVYVMLMFALVMAFTLTFNTITINILEREREIATIRTIGTQSWKISAMTTLENVIYGLFSMIPGFILGVGVGKYAMSLQQTEYFSISFVVYGSTFLMVAIGIILILLICQIPSLQYVKKVELAKATKERGG